MMQLLMLVLALAQDAGVLAPPSNTLPGLVNPPDILAATTTKQVALGEPMSIVITASHDAGMRLFLPDPIPLGAGFGVIRTAVETTPTQTRFQIEILPWELGDLMIPPIVIGFSQEGENGAVTTQPLPVSIRGAFHDSDIPELLPLAAPQQTYIRNDLLLGLLASAAIVLVLAILWRWRRTVKQAIEEDDIEEPTAIHEHGETNIDAPITVGSSSIVSPALLGALDKALRSLDNLRQQIQSSELATDAVAARCDNIFRTLIEDLQLLPEASRHSHSLTLQELTQVLAARKPVDVGATTTEPLRSWVSRMYRALFTPALAQRDQQLDLVAHTETASRRIASTQHTEVAP